MSLAAEIIIQPSRRLAVAVLAMALGSNLALGAWLLAFLRNQGPVEPDLNAMLAFAMVSLVWSASCVLTWYWWRARVLQRLVIERDGEAFWLDQPNSRGAQGLHETSPDVCPALAGVHAAARQSHAISRWRPVSGSLIWPGIISLQFVADAAQQQPERRSGSSSPMALVVLVDSVSLTEHRALALWMHWLQRKGVAPWVRTMPGSVRF